MSCHVSCALVRLLFITHLHIYSTNHTYVHNRSVSNTCANSNLMVCFSPLSPQMCFDSEDNDCQRGCQCTESEPYTHTTVCMHTNIQYIVQIHIFKSSVKQRADSAVLLAHRPSPMTSYSDNATIHTDVAYKTWSQTPIVCAAPPHNKRFSQRCSPTTGEENEWNT